MSVVTILIAAAIAAAVSYFLHTLDKDNNSLEKVKSYINKRQADFEAVLIEREKQINSSAAALKTEQMQAAAAVKVLEGKVEEFKKMAERLSGDSAAVQNIEEKISSYDEVLNDLINMTAKVEENLQLVKKESIVVDKLNSRLDAQDKNLSEIEKKIPQVTKEFSELNQNQLRLLGNELLKQYDSHGEKLKADITQIEGSAQKALASFQKEISAVYEEASLKANKLEDEAFEHLSQKAQERSDAYIQEMNQSVAQLDENLKASVQQLQDKFNAKLAEVQGLIDERSTKISTAAESKTVELDKKYNEFYMELSARLKQKTSEMEEELEVKSAEVQQTYKTTTETVVANMKKNLTDLDAKCKAHIDEIAAKYDERMNILSEKYSKQLEGVGGKSDARIADLVTKMQAAEEKSKAYIDALTAKYQAAVNTIKERYEASLESIDGKNNKHILELEQQYDQAYEVVNKKVMDSNAAFEAQSKADAEKIRASYENLLREIQTDYSTRMGQFNAEYEQAFQSFNDNYNKNLEDFNSKYGNTFENLRNQYEVSAQSFKSECDASFQELDNKYSEATASLRRELDDLTSRMEGSIATYDELAKKAESEIDACNEKIDAKIETVKSQLADTLQAISTNVTESVQTAENTVARVKEECATALKKVDEVEPELNEKVQAIDAQIEKFREQSNEKIAQLSEMLKNSGAKIQQMCEEQQTVALADVDKSLAAYKKDLEYRLSKIEASGSEIDFLESNLKAAMEEVSKKTLAVFDSFASEQQQKHAQFAASIKQNSDQLENDLNIIENKIEDLKNTAIGSMAEKLAGFEENFDRDLKTRGDKINDELATWKNDFDGKITRFTTEYENQRRELESEYNDNLKEKLAAVQSRSDEQAARIANGIAGAEASANDHINEIKQLISNFASEMQTKVNKVDESSDEALKNAIERNQKNIGDEINKLQGQMLEELKNFQESIQTRQENSISSVDSTISEFNAWKAQLKHQLDESKQIFNSELEGLKEAALHKVNDAKEYVDNEYSQIFDQNTRKIEDLSQKADESVAEYENRSKAILEQLKKMYEQMLRDTEERVRDQNADASRKIQDLNSEIQTAYETNKAHQSELVMNMQGYSNTMQTQMSELAKELQAVRSQISVYEKADQLKKALDDKIASLEGDFERIEGFKDIAADLNAQFNQIVKMKNETESQIDAFEVQKTKIDSIAQRYERMISLSGQIDEKIRTLTTTYDDLQTMEVQVRDFQDTLSAIAGRYDRLEQKNEVIDRVLKDVDTSFENLKALEDRLRACARQSESLPAEIRDVQHNVDELLKHGPKIGEAVAKLNSLQEILSDTESRLDSINSARQGVGRIEQRLQEMNNEVDGKFKLLQSIAKADIAKNPAKPDSHITPQEREQVKQLKRQGWTVAEIAKSLKRTQNEIELLLELPSD